MTERKDPHKHKLHYLNWKENGCEMPGVTDESKTLITHFLEDMELGINVSPTSKKGSRSYGRLMNLKAKMVTLTLIFQEELNITSLEELNTKKRDLMIIVQKMRDGKILTRKNKPFKATGTYMRCFQTYWNWYQRIKRNEDIEINSITADIDSRDPKPKFNYFTIDQIKKLCDEAKYDYKIVMMFLFDSGVRAPTELMNIKLSDLDWNDEKNFYTLNVREETSKTFGRRIKLLLCSNILKEYIQKNKFEKNDFLFSKSPQRFNQYLRTLGYNVLGIGTKEEKRYNGRKYDIIQSGLTLYDFRHSSACYWLPRYQSESALKYRFGWKKSEMIHYYTELLGMKDTIQEDDLYIDISKTELEKQMQKDRKKIELLREQAKDRDGKIEEMMKIIKAMQMERAIES